MAQRRKRSYDARGKREHHRVRTREAASRADAANRGIARTLGGRPDDRLLLASRAKERGLTPATCVSVLVRAHLRNVTPLPKDELLALKQSIAELRAIGRNLNPMSHALNHGRESAPGVHEVMSMLKVAEALRGHFKALLIANQRSWEQGRRQELRARGVRSEAPLCNGAAHRRATPARAPCCKSRKRAGRQAEYPQSDAALVALRVRGTPACIGCGRMRQTAPYAPRIGRHFVIRSIGQGGGEIPKCSTAARSTM